MVSHARSRLVERIAPHQVSVLIVWPLGVRRANGLQSGETIPVTHIDADRAGRMREGDDIQVSLRRLWIMLCRKEGERSGDLQRTRDVDERRRPQLVVLDDGPLRFADVSKIPTAWQSTSSPLADLIDPRPEV